MNDLLLTHISLLLVTKNEEMKLEKIRHVLKRGHHFWGSKWVTCIIQTLGFESTLCRIGRSRKGPQKGTKMCLPPFSLFLFFLKKCAGQHKRTRIKEGIIVRPLQNYDMPHHLRVTIGSRAENKRLIKALQKVLCIHGV